MIKEELMVDINPISLLRELGSIKRKLGQKALVCLGMAMPSALSIPESPVLGTVATTASTFMCLNYLIKYDEVMVQADTLSRVLVRSIENDGEV